MSNNITPFKLEAVITCVDYSDFLAETLPLNRTLFDRLVVVTAPEDKGTRRICEHWNVTCIPTDTFDSRWGKFCKGCGINVGLQALDKDGWAMHLDADIVCPPLTRELLQGLELDPTYLYGFDRHEVRGHEAWRKFMAMPMLQHESQTWIHADAFPMGTRLMIGNYVPLGFAQLWHPNGSGMTVYPEQHTTAARTDVQFAQNWPRGKRGFIPEIIMYHLMSEDAVKASNWNGRTTARFGPEGQFKPPVAKARRPGEPEIREEY